MGAIQNDDARKVEKQQAPEGQQPQAKPREYIPAELEIPAEFVGQDGTVLKSGTLKLTMTQPTVNFLASIVLSAMMAYDTGDFEVDDDEDDEPEVAPAAEAPQAQAEQG